MRSETNKNMAFLNVFCPIIVLAFCAHLTQGQSHDLEELPYVGNDVRGTATIRPHVHCPFFPRPGEEVRITANFFYAIKNYGNQPMRGFIDYSICDSVGNCENERKRYYVPPLGHTQGSLATTLVKRYEPDVAGNRMQAFAESAITGSVVAEAKAMCYYTVRRGGYHHLRYDWTAN